MVPAKVSPPWKSFAWVPRLMSWVVPAVVLVCVNVARPVTVKAPLWVSAPLLLTVSVPDTVLVPSTVAALFSRLTSLPTRLTAPVKSLPVLSSVMASAPASKVDVPATVNAPP